MSKRYQNGHLRCAKRKSGLQCWEFLWRENNGNGKRVCRTAIIGTVAQLPTEQLAGAAANGLRVHINSDNKRCCIVPISILLKQKSATFQCSVQPCDPVRMARTGRESDHSRPAKCEAMGRSRRT